jgi:hypothetical protein
VFRWVRGQIWAIPLLFTIVVGGVGWRSFRTLEADTKAQLASQLQTILEADVTALRVWVETHRSVVEVVAQDPRVGALVVDLAAVARSRSEPREALLRSPELAELRELLGPTLRAHGYLGFAVIDPFGLRLAAAADRGVGRRLRKRYEVIDAALEGRAVVSRPLVLESEAPAGAAPEAPAAGDAEPVLLALAPIRDPAGTIVAVIGTGVSADRDFTQILTVARMGESGETYAFDADGLMLSDSRFDDQLVAAGLLPDRPEARSTLAVQIRDPGGNVVEGFATDVPLRARPLTRMAGDAVQGRSGVDVDGYRDYRGVPVVGAWTWLPELGMGVATEIDAGEAFAGLRADRARFGWILGLLGVGTVGMFLYSTVLVRMRRKVDKARRLGRYRIEEKIGEGGMGKVYRARHALLRRPTAIKLLESADSSSEAVARFEREVQVTSRLTHPNTIAVFDFGHTPEGTFYYAMEYLDGITVGRCVEEDGAQPEARVVHIMKQACGSIAEAHAADLIHRDLKPANVMLCQRGGMLDFVKVLDFGLVRDEKSRLALTRADALTGTPLYLSPEALQSPETIDARSDLYQLGAIAYYLLTGRHVFSGETVADVLGKHLHSAPERPSSALGRPVSPDLEGIVLACLEKDRNRRPASAAELLDAFERCRVEGEWTQREARAWWERWWALHPVAEGAAPESSAPSGYQVDLDDRSG